MRIESISYEFFGTKITSEIPPVIEISNGSNAEGYIEIAIPNLTTPILTATLHKLLVPTYTEPRYFKTGNDLYTVDRVYYSSSTLTNNNLRIYWIIDTGAIGAIDSGEHYCLTFWINQASTATAVKCSVSVIVKISNFFKE